MTVTGSCPESNASFRRGRNALQWIMLAFCQERARLLSVYSRCAVVGLLLEEKDTSRSTYAGSVKKQVY